MLRWPAPIMGLPQVLQLLVTLLPTLSAADVPNRQLTQRECHVDLLIKNLVFSRLTAQELQLVKGTVAATIASATGRGSDDIMSLSKEPAWVTLTSGAAS